MEIKINLDELRQRGLFVATPCYGGMCTGPYANALAELTAICVAHGIPFKKYMLNNESLITRARNYSVDEFLRSTDTNHLLFIDADIEFNARDVIAMMALQTPESPYDVLGGCYPKKTIAWEKILAAVNAGFADETPERLNDFVGDYVFNPIVEPGAPTEIPLSEPAEVSETGTGFMMIRRSTFEMYDKSYPELLYYPDHVRSEHFDGARQIMAYFDTIIEPKSRRYLSEDYMFCYNIRKAGGKVYICPWIKLKHMGSYTFGGSLFDLAQLGLNPTADRELLKKSKKKKG